MAFWKKFGQVAVAIGKSTAALTLPTAVTETIDRVEAIITGPGKGKEKAAAVEQEIQDKLLPALETLTGRNLSDPAIQQLTAKFRDAYVAYKNAETALVDAKDALEAAIDAVQQPAKDAPAA